MSLRGWQKRNRQSKAWRLVDALGRMTPDQIANLMYAEDCEGMRERPDQCPVARYIMLHTKTTSVRVEGAQMVIYGQAYPLPESVREFVEAFDQGRFTWLKSRRSK